MTNGVRWYQRLVVPIRPGVAAELYVPALMTPSDWEQFMDVLYALKPGLVQEAAERMRADDENRPDG